MTTIYCFAANGNYIGQNVVPNNPNTGKPKLIPDNATTTPPPGPGAKWDGKKWLMPGETKKKTVAKKSTPPPAPKVSEPGDLQGPVVDATDLPDTEDKSAENTEDKKDTPTLDLKVGAKKKRSTKKANRP